MAHIVLDQELIDYMKRKGFTVIALEAVSPKGCCVDMTELSARFVRAKDIEAVRNRACGIYETPVGQLLVLSREIELEDEVRFGLRSFLGVKDISIEGAAAWRI